MFLSGLLSIWIALGSPLARLDHQWLTAHMAQHLLLMTVGAPLVLSGAPVTTLAHGLPRRLSVTVLEIIFRHPLVQRSLRMISQPLFCWLAGTAAVIGWHIPALFELAMESARWHELENASFLVAGLLFWLPIVQPVPEVLATWPRWGVPGYLFLATLPCDGLSAFLAFCDRVVYPHYLSAPGSSIMSTLKDQATAGALMWVWVTLVYLAPAVIVTFETLSPRRREGSLEVV
jgi:cytochrome c oxidase assembly factor CtaG